MDTTTATQNEYAELVTHVREKMGADLPLSHFRRWADSPVFDIVNPERSRIVRIWHEDCTVNVYLLTMNETIKARASFTDGFGIGYVTEFVVALLRRDHD